MTLRARWVTLRARWVTLNQQLMALLATAAGEATVRETVFEGRLAHARELQRMGASLTLLDGSSAHIHGA